MKRTAILVLVFSAGAATAQAVAVAFTALALPVVAATDARYITYTHNAGGWHVQGPVCPRADPAQVTGITTLPCLETVVDIPAPSGAFVTKLISDYKLVVLATGYPSGD